MDGNLSRIIIYFLRHTHNIYYLYIIVCLHRLSRKFENDIPFVQIYEKSMKYFLFPGNPITTALYAYSICITVCFVFEKKFVKNICFFFLSVA